MKTKHVRFHAKRLVPLLVVLSFGAAFVYKARAIKLKEEKLALSKENKTDNELELLRKYALSQEAKALVKYIAEGNKPQISFIHTNYSKSHSLTIEQTSMLALCNLMMASYAESPLDKLDFVNRAINGASESVRKAPEDQFARAARLFVHRKLPQTFADADSIQADSSFLQQFSSRKETF